MFLNKPIKKSIKPRQMKSKNILGKWVYWVRFFGHWPTTTYFKQTLIDKRITGRSVIF